MAQHLPEGPGGNRAAPVFEDVDMRQPGDPGPDAPWRVGPAPRAAGVVPAALAPPDPVRERRIRTLTIDAKILLDLLYALDGTRRVQCGGVPPDAAVVGVAVWSGTLLQLYVASAAFAPVPVGATDYPEHRVEFAIRE
jgi:hypothetical protein